MNFIESLSQQIAERLKDKMNGFISEAIAEAVQAQMGAAGTNGEAKPAGQRGTKRRAGSKPVSTEDREKRQQQILASKALAAGATNASEVAKELGLRPAAVGSIMRFMYKNSVLGKTRQGKYTKRANA